MLLKKKIPEYITNERKMSPDEENADKEMFDHEDFKED